MPQIRSSASQSKHAAARLIEGSVASGIAEQRAETFNYSAAAKRSAEHFLGWAHLATNPPTSLGTIQQVAQECIDEGLERVILIGQGGSSQAPMTATKLTADLHPTIRFSTLDSLSPLYLNKVLTDCDVTKTIFIVSSKSGGTLEVLSMFKIIWQYVLDQLMAKGIANPLQVCGTRFIAITDPESKLEETAHSLGFRHLFHGEPQVGGRFSALSVFGLVPLALVGIDIHDFVARAARMERRCALDLPDNPAIVLANFLYENNSSESAYAFSYMSTQPGRVFGLWIEQMIAESLGKDGRGIVPQIEIDPRLLNPPYPSRPCVAYRIQSDERFDHQISVISDVSPLAVYTMNDPMEMGAHFVMWEYATALLGWLLKVAPFNQPDVQLAKVNTARALHDLLPNQARYVAEPWLICQGSRAFMERCTSWETVTDALVCLLSQVQPHDYLCVNAFLPFTGLRREPIEHIRHQIGSRLGIPTCLEIGPRYLHSTGQLHKGGPNTGVFLLISANETNDRRIPGETYSLGELVVAQAKGDLATLSDKGRRALHIHLIDADHQTIWKLACAVEEACKQCARYSELPFDPSIII